MSGRAGLSRPAAFGGSPPPRQPRAALPAGEDLPAALMPAAALLAPDDYAAYDLLLRVAAAAGHGIAVFLRQGPFGFSEDALDQTAQRAARTARDIRAPD